MLVSQAGTIAAECSNLEGRAAILGWALGGLRSLLTLRSAGRSRQLMCRKSARELTRAQRASVQRLKWKALSAHPWLCVEGAKWHAHQTV